MKSKKTQVTIYHNPRCTKSRQTLALIREQKIEPIIVEYLKELPSENELKELVKKLKITPDQLIRRSEKVFKEKYKGKVLSADEWIKAMLENPKLIERPIVIKGNKAIIGRPPERVLELTK